VIGWWPYVAPPEANDPEGCWKDVPWGIGTMACGAKPTNGIGLCEEHQREVLTGVDDSTEAG
jgi:hypothetical protein